MQRKPPARKAPRVLILLVLLAVVGLFAATYQRKIRRLEIEGARPGEIELVAVPTVSTQVMSMDVGEEVEIDNPLEKQTMMMRVPPEKPPAPIVQTNPKARRGIDEYEVAAARRASEEFARTNINKPAEKIVMD